MTSRDEIESLLNTVDLTLTDLPVPDDYSYAYRGTDRNRSADAVLKFEGSASSYSQLDGAYDLIQHQSAVIELLIEAVKRSQSYKLGYTKAIDNVKEFSKSLDPLSENRLMEACSIIINQLVTLQDL